MSDKEKSAGLLAFAEKTGHTYKNISLLETALTHSSYANEMKSKGARAQCNERLEFLGDAVLSLITSEYIYKKLKGCTEGELTRIRATVVCEDSLFGFAESIGLGDALFLGKGEMASGRHRKSTLADAFEAVLGSIFIDGGLDAAKKFLFGFIEKPIEAITLEGETKDYKTLLQQMIQQGGGGETLEYALTGESGPAHERVFEVKAMMNSNIIGEGKGSSKKAAEQNAAKEALALFGY